MVNRFLRGLAGLAPADIQSVAAAAGFSGPDLATAVAIALAESGGNPNAYNPEIAAGTPQLQGSYGLWQIYRRAHPEFAGVNLFDPQTNARAAFAIYSAGGGFSQWSTYKSGKYLAYLQPVAPAPETAPGAPPPLTIDAATGQVIEDTTPTPAVAGPAWMPTTPLGRILLLTGAAIGVSLLADTLWGD